ncbi:alkaline phosphatase family protein [Nonomuraea sp. NBC_01738]|uniref:alkaline phosphatase family protein n=1 Tax=Nonomuraea sp. NBC_01738 TaxID=2976003 RepID=UPI002E0D9C21|nr:alkaline phosphatase family protein [Nonomuraea sp. NBC_01738]
MTEHLTDRVVVFGVDGVRHDTLLAARTPAVDAIAAAGFLAPFRVNDAGPTISGPGWTTIATGVLATKHRVFNNDLTEHQISKFPDFLSRAREVGFSTYAAGSWPQLVTETHGGPIFLGGGSMPCGDDPETAEAFDRADQLVADEAAGVLGERDIAAAFVYFGLPDVVAHAEGPTADYAASVEACDRRIGQVMAAIRGREPYAKERWTFVVVTDHGHTDQGGHGGESEQERTAWIAAAGRDVPSRAPEGLEQADVHAHVLHALGIAARPAWELTGRAFCR